MFFPENIYDTTLCSQDIAWAVFVTEEVSSAGEEELGFLAVGLEASRGRVRYGAALKS